MQQAAFPTARSGAPRPRCAARATGTRHNGGRAEAFDGRSGPARRAATNGGRDHGQPEPLHGMAGRRAAESSGGTDQVAADAANEQRPALFESH